MVPELIRTNRQILEEMRASQEESRNVRQLALELEDHRAAHRTAEAHENRARHEETMHLFRNALNPHAEAISAMHAGAASLHQAAQDVSASAAQHRAMAADSSHLFLTAIRQGIEAMQATSSSSGPPPPPPGGGVVIQRADEAPIAGPEVAMSVGKRALSLEEVERNTKKAVTRAASAAARGASRAASASAAPATKEEEQPSAPGYQPEAAEPARAVQPYGKAIGKALKPRLNPIAKSVRGRSTQPRIVEHDESGGRPILPIVGGVELSLIHI